MENQGLISFEGKEIRKIWHAEEWYFSVIDVIGILTQSNDPSDYWTTMKRREKQLPTICRKFKFAAADNKMRPTDCANTEGVFRIIMSVPSPKAEPLKLWMAQVSQERIQETENPELLTERQAELYRVKGYPNDWIERRLKSIDVRKELTDEWKQRDVKEGQDFSILTATIAKGTFGLNPSEHSKLKGLDKENLRDHMSELELIFTMLSESATRSIAIRDDAQGFNENLDAAQKAGSATGDARRNFEKNAGLEVVTGDNFLGLKEAENDKTGEISEAPN